jgi:cell division protein DivIC
MKNLTSPQSTPRKPHETPNEPVKKRRRFRRVAYLTFWVGLILMFGFLAMTQASQYSVLQSDLARIHEEIERAEMEHERLRRQLEFIGSDAYIEEQARRRLGLVLPTELIFINVGQ